MKKLALLFSIIILYSCSEYGEKTKDVTAKSQEEIITIKELDFPKIPDLIISDSISILLATSYSSGEIKLNIDSMNWIGLFSNEDDSNFTCCKTKLKTKKVLDQMVDQDGKKTGTLVYCENFDSKPILLIAGIETAESIHIDSYLEFQNELLPGESMQLGSSTITASGIIDDRGFLIDYKLAITGEKNGMNIEHVFIEQNEFADDMLRFIWAGDIDKDGISDLYMDISPKYSYSKLALFLSSKAGENELLKKVAEINIYGC